MDRAHLRLLLQPLRQRQRVRADALQAQRERFRADRDVMRLLRGQRAAPVAQALLAQLLQAPVARRLALVGVGDVRILRPVEEPGVGDAAGQRVAVAADVLGQRIDDEARADRARLEQPRRRHRVVDDVEDAPRAAELADARQVRHLHARVGDRLDEHDTRRRRERGFDVARRRSRRPSTPHARAPRASAAGCSCCRTRTGSATMWSPAFSSASMMAPIAAMPVANVTVPTPPSIAVILASSAADVGLPCRP